MADRNINKLNYISPFVQRQFWEYLIIFQTGLAKN
jgi:hypothetical protein